MQLSSQFFFVLLMVTIGIGSCRKIDKQLDTLPSLTTLESRFFNSHKSSNPLVLATLEILRTDNQQMQFVKKIVDQIGFPFWDKSLI